MMKKQNITEKVLFISHQKKKRRIRKWNKERKQNEMPDKNEIKNKTEKKCLHLTVRES